MMIATAFLLLVSQSEAAAPSAESGDVEVQKQIVYQKETNVDLSGSNVEGENQVPPAFFLSKNLTAKAKGLLEERLRFSLRNYNDLGF